MPAQETAASAQAFAGSALPPAVFPQLSGATAQESAVAIPESGALTGGVPALAHEWAARPHKWAAPAH